MRLFWLIYRNEIVFCLLIIGLVLWGAVATVSAFKNKGKTILISQTEGFYQVIGEKKKSPLETENFIRHFLGLTLNFDNESYRRHISLAGDLMTESLWKKKKLEFQETAGFVKKNKIIQSSEILGIKKIKANSYEVKIRNYLFKNGSMKEKNKLILLSLTESKRSFENPWRHSVSNVEVK